MKITYTNYRPVALWHWDVSSGNPAASSSSSSASSSKRALTDRQDARDAAEDDDADDDPALDGLGSDDDEDADGEEEDYGPCAICHSDYDSACPTCKVPGDDCPLSA